MCCPGMGEDSVRGIHASGWRSPCCNDILMEHLSHPPEQHKLCMYFNEALCLPTYSLRADRERVRSMFGLCGGVQSHSETGAVEIYFLDPTCECVYADVCEEMVGTTFLRRADARALAYVSMTLHKQS